MVMGVLRSKEGCGLFSSYTAIFVVFFGLGYVILGFRLEPWGIFCGHSSSSLFFLCFAMLGFLHFFVFFCVFIYAMHWFRTCNPYYTPPVGDISHTHTNFFILYSSSNFTNQTLLFNIHSALVPVTAWSPHVGLMKKVWINENNVLLRRDSLPRRLVVLVAL